MAYVTKHAKKRAHTRCGIGKQSLKRIADKVLDNGVRHSECTGHLKRWIDSLYFKEQTANNIRLYGDKAYLFEGRTLITIIQIPNNLLVKVHSIQKRKTKDVE